MSKFLPINDAGELLNADLIAHIIPADDGGCVVITKDGQRFHSEFNLYDEMDENNTILAILPCSGISAVYLNDDGTTEIRPCPFVLLLDSGKLEPFIFLTDDALEFMASEGVTGFVGFAPSK